MKRTRSPARLVVALSVAAALAIFLVYNAVAGARKPSLSPSEVRGHNGRVSLVGRVVGQPAGDAHGAGLRFRLRDIGSREGKTVTVVYRGTVPDFFGPKRHVVVDGQLRNGVFVAVPGTLVTKCPSKYSKRG